MKHLSTIISNELFCVALGFFSRVILVLEASMHLVDEHSQWPTKIEG